MGHSDIPEPPKPPSEGERPLNMPDISCLEPEEIKLVGEITLAIAAAMKSGLHAMLEVELDKMTAAGGHVAGHSLQGFLWCCYQVMLGNNGIDGAKQHEVLVFSHVETDEPTEATDRLADLVGGFIGDTLSGRYVEAMDKWGEFLDAIGEDWEQYATAVTSILQQAVQIMHSRPQVDDSIPGELLPEGATALRIVGSED